MRDARKLFLELKNVVPDYNPSGDILSYLLSSEPEHLGTPVAPLVAHEVAA
jgi:hypothetical protein